MPFNFNQISFDTLIASDTTNYNIPNEKEIGQGVVLRSSLTSSVVNSLINKLSASIKYNQDLGFTAWIDSHKYQIGSVVQCLVIENQIPKIMILRCIKNTLNQDYCTEPPLKGKTTLDNGVIYFTSDQINYEYWNGVTIESFNKKKISVSDFNFSYPNNSDDSQIKNIELINFNSYSGFVENIFILSIKRGGKQLVSTIHIHGLANGGEWELIVNDTWSNAYTGFDSSSNIFNQNSRFKDIALLGCFLSKNQDNTLSLNICGRGSGASGNIEIETSLKNGNINPNPIEKSRSYSFLDQYQNIVIPFKNGASNAFLGVGQLKRYFEPLNFKEVFKNGLIRIDNEKSLDQFVYPGVNLVTASNKVYNVDNRFLTSGKSQRYISQELPNIKGKLNMGGYASGSTGNYMVNAYYGWAGSNLSFNYLCEGALSNEIITTRQYLTNLQRVATGSPTLYAWTSGYLTASSDNKVLMPTLDASRSNAIYKDSGNVLPNATNSYIYIQGF